MCYYIAFAIPATIEQQARMLLPTNLELQSNRNKSFRALVPHTYQTFFLTTEICSCELYEKTENNIYGFRADVQHYFTRLAKYITGVFLHIHFYRGDIESEILPITHSQQIHLKQTRSTAMEQDCLYHLILA
jgi:hypothetical protein